MPKSHLSEVDIPEVALHTAVLNMMDMYAERTAIVDGVSGKEYNYEEVAHNIRTVASALYKLGIRKGDIVAMFSYNTPQFVFMLYGALIAGATVTTVNPAYTSYELTHHLKDSGSSWLYTVTSLLDTAQTAAQNVGTIKSIVVDGGGAGCVSMATLLADDGSAVPDVEVDPREDVAVILYSSGTTGLPKGVMITHYNLMANLMQLSHPDAADPSLVEAGQLCILAYLPFFHAYGLVITIAGSMMGGQKIVTLPHFDPHLFLKSIEKYKVSVLLLVPPIVVFLAKSPMVKNYDLSSVIRAASGAAPLSPEVEKDFKDRLKLPDMRQGYGMTEMTCAGTHQPVTMPHKAGSSGLPLPNTEIVVVDVDTGKRLGPHQRGELYMRGPNVMRGYYNKPEATRSTLDEEGWLHTGDVGYYDEDNYFFIVDRLKELIKYKGFQVAPAELEALLLTHPQVADAAVIGVADEAAGEVPRAYVVRKDGNQLTDEDVKKFVAGKLANFKHLRGGVEFVASIPKSPSGKILRRELRAKLNKSRL